MNDNEIQRIAAAVNMLRPDWPTKQLETLLRDQRITTRPRRDVAIALVYVACESDTKNPYRVIEAGPWWQATGAFADSSGKRVPTAEECCQCCGKTENACRQGLSINGEHWGHIFTPFHAKRPNRPTPERMRELAEEARKQIEAALPPVEESWMARRPTKCTETDCDRGYQHTGPHRSAPNDSTDGEAAA